LQHAQAASIALLEVAISSRLSPMKTKWDLTQEAFERLLAWLDPDREQAGTKYEKIRLQLIKIFTCRGCTCPDDLADQTINRVGGKIQEIEAGYTGDHSLYFYGVARNVHLEYVRKRQIPAPPPAPEPRNESDLEYECLDRCMQRLATTNRELILQYFLEEKQAKIDHRKALAQQMGIGSNALRIQIHRIRTGLRQCVMDCVKKG
jgi:DNA-directed RNA polymerase specialized sigma24 family protein